MIRRLWDHWVEARWLLEEAGLRTTPVPLWAQASTRVSLIRRLEAMESLIVRLKCTYKLAHFQLCLRLDFSSQTDLPPRPIFLPDRKQTNPRSHLWMPCRIFLNRMLPSSCVPCRHSLVLRLAVFRRHRSSLQPQQTCRRALHFGGNWLGVTICHSNNPSETL